MTCFESHTQSGTDTQTFSVFSLHCITIKPISRDKGCEGHSWWVILMCVWVRALRDASLPRAQASTKVTQTHWHTGDITWLEISFPFSVHRYLSYKPHQGELCGFTSYWITPYINQSAGDEVVAFPWGREKWTSVTEGEQESGQKLWHFILFKDIHTLNKRERLSYFTQSIYKAFRHNRS